MFNKNDLISLLEEITTLLEFRGENTFKISAFRNAAFIIQNYKEDFEVLIKKNKLDSLKGIGKGLQSVIMEFYDNGGSSMLEELKKDIPESLFELFSLRGLGPKKIYLLHNQYNISDISALEDACKRNILASIKGFGEKTQQKILDSIDKYKESKKKVLLNYAEKTVKLISEKLSEVETIEKFICAGEYRRGREVISSLDFVILVKTDFKPAELAEFINIEESGKGKLVSMDYPIPVTFHIVNNESDFLATTILRTGSEDFFSKLFHKTGFDWSKIKSEEDLFKQNKTGYIPPEQWETEYYYVGSVKILPSDLDEKKPKGMLHFHTEFSDGIATLEEMVAKATEYGFEYFAVCDHSKSAFYANGLTEERVLLQKAEIERLRREKDYKILHGVESDILPDGNLDYPDDFLPTFDFIVASVHSSFSQPEEEMTKRIIRAIENPFTDVVGHLTGRLLLYRNGYNVDTKKILDACAANQVAIEINSSPHRLDLDWRWYYYATEKNLLFAINQDAHSTDEIRNIGFGIRMAKKGGIQSDRVINYFSYTEFKKFLNRKRNK
ncbi:MAG: DNA polymerase/3'-5' exonuclease PolX [Ignavibacteriales bacterium]|nr:DNA polymerase/3'-5' exonuclease PolX [Ignavibacteriales bacterium]